MQDAFAIVLFVVVGVASVLAVVALITSGGSLREIGRGGLFEDDAPPGEAPATVRDDEIRQMLEARNARRTARGEDEVDVEAELAALTRPPRDPALEAEIRELVESRNRRRIARGSEPLDVDAEVERRLRDR